MLGRRKGTDSGVTAFGALAILVILLVYKPRPQVDSGLSLKQKMVLLMLANRVNSDTGRCDPSMERLAEDCGMSRTSVKQAIRQLKDAGLILAHERKVGTVNLTNQYELMVSENTGVGRDTPGGGAQDARGVGRDTPPNQEIQSGKEPEPCGSLFSDDLETSRQEPEVDHFEEFWKAYPTGPRKTDKPKARKAFYAITQGKHKDIGKTDARAIVEAVGRYAASNPDPQYLPMPTTWLNGERWLQWPASAEPRRPGQSIPFFGEVVR